MLFYSKCHRKHILDRKPEGLAVSACKHEMHKASVLAKLTFSLDTFYGNFAAGRSANPIVKALRRSNGVVVKAVFLGNFGGVNSLDVFLPDFVIVVHPLAAVSSLENHPFAVD